MKLLERLQAQLEQLTAASTTPFDKRVAEAKQAHAEHLDIFHAEEDRNHALNTIVRTVRLEALRIKQYVDRKEVYKLAGSSYPLHPHKNAEVLQALAQRLEEQSVSYGVKWGMSADEVRTLVRDVWVQTINSKSSTSPLQRIIAANKPCIPSDGQQPSFNPSADAIKWLDLAKAEYEYRIDWDWGPGKAKELVEEFIEQVIFQASRSMGVVWADGTKRTKLSGSDLVWLERAIKQHCAAN